MYSNLKKKVMKNKLVLASIVILIILVIISILAFASPYDPNAIDVANKLKSPSLKHPFGTDDMGRDYFTRALYGGRVSLMVGFSSMIISTILGTLIGTISGYFGGWIDTFIMRTIDVLMSILSFFIILTLIFNHIIPNVMPSVIVAATINVANSILMESSLSFLGLGIQAPNASWGSMLQNAQGYILDMPYLAVFPGLLILMTVLSFNVIGDFMRDVTHPRKVR